MDEAITINTWLHEDTSRIDFCKIEAEKSKLIRPHSNELLYWSEMMRTVFSTRLPEDVYVGINNFMKLFREDITVDDIQNALVMIHTFHVSFF